jgi:SAM-dependent methyltransferase
MSLSRQSATQFEPEDFALCYPPGIENHYWTAARNHIIERQLKATELEQPRILEVGCGPGVVVAYLRERGYQCHGVELTGVVPRESVKDYVRTGIGASDIPRAERESFDTLLLLDVIEHLPDPSGFLSELKGAFPNASHVILTVPARQELWSNYDIFYRHYRRYDLEMLGAIIQGIGGTVLDMKYFFHLLYLPARIVVSLFQHRQVKIRAPRNGMKHLHSVICRICIADYSWVPGRVYGTSIICAAKLAA